MCEPNRFPGPFDKVGEEPTCELPRETNAGFIVGTAPVSTGHMA